MHDTGGLFEILDREINYYLLAPTLNRQIARPSAAIQIETIPQRQNEADNAARHAQALHVFQGFRKRGFAGRRRERQHRGFFDQLEEALEGKPNQEGYGHKNNQDEHAERAVQGENQKP